MFKKFALFALITLVAPLSSFAATPKEYSEGLANKVIAIIQSQSTESAKEDQLVQLFKQNVDTDFMGKFTMGKYFRTLTPEQKTKYLGLYRDYVIYTYIPKFRLYSGEKMNVIQVIKEDEGSYTVKSSIATKQSSTGSVLVDYKLEKAGDSFKIIDVIGEGVSLITTQRSDFSTPLADQGVDAFIAKLGQKVADLKAHPPINTKKIEKLSSNDKSAKTAK